MREKNRVIMIFVILIIGVTGITYGVSIFVINNISEKSIIPPNTYPFKDSMNRVVYVPIDPQRIISTAPAITEALFAIGAENKLVGRTTYCNYPIEAESITSIGGFSTPNLEIIASLNPDLILASTTNSETIVLLENQGYTIVNILAETLDEIIRNMGIIGNLVNNWKKSVYLMHNMLVEMEKITNKTTTLNTYQKIDCYFEIWETPMVAGTKSFIHDMIIKAGAINIFGDLDFEHPIISHENVISRDPDVIFISEHSASWYSQDVASRSGYDIVNACINNRIYQCFDDIYLRPGPRIINALENMTRYLYPNLFI
ncbi:MAG: ABC transporter substrate-binding protein [Candidatus Lokiarchaeota archaeon]|nr:ABC transporter substrate-binding protein [Candidatus Lokiarchaeota archaeon]